MPLFIYFALLHGIMDFGTALMFLATYDALHFIFNFYNFPLTKKDYADTTLLLGYRIENHYKIISEKMGYRINPSENTVNSLGYNALYLNNLALAEYFFKLNVNNYPDSYNSYNSFGDYYFAVGNFEQAIRMYKKALSIYDNMETRAIKSVKSIIRAMHRWVCGGTTKEAL